MNDKPAPLRYKYSGSYAGPEKLYFGSDWMSEEACRTAVSTVLADSAVRRDSIHVVVQHKKSRWLPLKWWPAVELFPEIVAEVARKAAVHAVSA